MVVLVGSAVASALVDNIPLRRIQPCRGADLLARPVGAMLQAPPGGAQGERVLREVAVETDR